MTSRTAIYALLASCLAGMAHADLKSALAAYDRQDSDTAFEQFQQLAKLGRAEAQENLAVMYVNGQGVKRDNVMGYAWASLALEQDPGAEAAKGILAQLEPHLTDAARTRVAELRSQYGRDALQANVLPLPDPTPSPADCLITRPVNPDDYVPMSSTPGRVLIETTVMPDGHARNPRVLYETPKQLYREAARQVAMATGYKAPVENGVPRRCVIRFYVKFGGSGDPPSEFREKFPAIRVQAMKGDPEGQFLYGLALMLEPALGSPADAPSTAWLLKAAQGGVPTAQFLVGFDTLNGLGFQRDETKGLFWLERAAAQGQVKALVALASYLQLPGTTTEQHARALECLDKAVSMGSVDARYHIAALLAAGPEASQRNPARALALLGEVMRDGDKDPAPFEIRAAAQAALGKFDEARKNQKKAIMLAARLGWDLEPLRQRQALYAANQAWAGELMVY